MPFKPEKEREKIAARVTRRLLEAEGEETSFAIQELAEDLNHEFLGNGPQSLAQVDARLTELEYQVAKLRNVVTQLRGATPLPTAKAA